MNLSPNNDLPFISRLARVGFSVSAAVLFAGIASVEDGRPAKPNVGWGY